MKRPESGWAEPARRAWRQPPIPALTAVAEEQRPASHPSCQTESAATCPEEAAEQRPASHPVFPTEKTEQQVHREQVRR